MGRRIVAKFPAPIQPSRAASGRAELFDDESLAAAAVRQYRTESDKTGFVNTSLQIWLFFAALTLLLIGVDLFVLHRKPHEVSLREALLSSAGWIGVAMLFDAWIYAAHGGSAPAVDFLAAYVIEKTLSVDNVFLFILIFRSFQVPAELQHRVLYYGVVGALFLRGAFIFGGVALLAHFHFVAYLFGLFLVVAGIRMLRGPVRFGDPGQNFVVRSARRWLPVSDRFDGPRMFVRPRGAWLVTPLLLALIAVEVSDLLFAMDSVPAVLAITRDTFIAYTSNVFAILGLRSLYFALVHVLPRFRYLHQGLAAVLVFIGAKMLLSELTAIPSWVSLAGVFAILGVAAALSIMSKGKNVNGS